MNYDQKYLLWLAGCGARGAKAPAPVQMIDWRRLIRDAGRLGLLPFAAYAIKNSPGLSCPKHLRRRMTAEIMVQDLQYYNSIKKQCSSRRS